MTATRPSAIGSSNPGSSTTGSAHTRWPAPVWVQRSSGGSHGRRRRRSRATIRITVSSGLPGRSGCRQRLWSSCVLRSLASLGCSAARGAALARHSSWRAGAHPRPAVGNDDLPELQPTVDHCCDRSVARARDLAPECAAWRRRGPPRAVVQPPVGAASAVTPRGESPTRDS